MIETIRHLAWRLWLKIWRPARIRDAEIDRRLQQLSHALTACHSKHDNPRVWGESLTRLSAINRDIDVVYHSLTDLLRHVAEQHTTNELTASRLRANGHKLVSLAGDLTRLGVDMAHWADELDRSAEASPPTTDEGQ